MPHWNPEQMWKGQDAYIIGGGPSLKTFDWELIRERNTIGCNSAFSIGHEFCKITIFGDFEWWDRIGRKGTEEYGGIVVGSSPRLHSTKCPWLRTMPRAETQGLSTTALCWAGNTGALAINLALILGAQRVFLLGFDMKLSPKGKANWHDLRYEPDDLGNVYGRFNLQLEKQVCRSLPKVFPGREIFNVNDHSHMNCFPEIGVVEHFESLEEKAS